jgi:hypothetical protein
VAARTGDAVTPLKLPEPLSPCPDGGHVLHPHVHLWHLPGYDRRRCLGRFWCVRCKRWLTGEKCKPVPAKAA